MSRPRNSKGEWISDEDIRKHRLLIAGGIAIGIIGTYAATVGF
ncbi:hypothetical protein SAMN04488556_4149 [Halostagnicola kamekurae]|uniref:Uncharacterized protein n=1 Tax=Halostagnicola kamekurae TaxID=619731 RepID=A0A1I6UXN9_9EURY|nr:hypothetical protein SAMN04488556_4149 [Halostagnicola kamekurae]